MPAFNKFNTFTQAIFRSTAHDFDSDVFKIMLTNTAPVATNTVKANLVEIAAGNGYVVGGNAATYVSAVTVWPVCTVKLNDVVFTATGGTIGPFRYYVLYDDTSASDLLVGWWDYGSSLTLNAGDTFTVDFSATNGVLQITAS